MFFCVTCNVIINHWGKTENKIQQTSFFFIFHVNNESKVFSLCYCEYIDVTNRIRQDSLYEMDFSVFL